MLVARTSNFGLGHAGAKTSGPRSNSWLPGAMASTADPVQDVDDMRALVEARKQRGRDGVARMDEEGIALRALLLDDRCELGEAAAALLGAHPVDVVGLDEANSHRLLCQNGAGQQERQSEKAGADGGKGTALAHGRVSFDRFDLQARLWNLGR